MDHGRLTAALTLGDRISVWVYRGGLVLAALCLALACVLGLRALTGTGADWEAGLVPSVFWMFFAGVGLSVSCLHLYSRPILRTVRVIFVLSALFLIPLALAQPPAASLADLLHDARAVAGGGLLLAAFAAIGAKEAYCFGLREGYLFAPLGVLPPAAYFAGASRTGWVLLLLATLTVLAFTVRKLRLPLHFDIGDKSRY